MPVVINSRFTPLTYDEITKPLIQQTEAQQAMEEAYATASDKAAEVMAEANQQTDPIAYNKLRAYSEDLQKQADALMSKGLHSGSRRALLDMRRRYGQEIAPLQKAAETRKEWAKEQQQARLKNPNLRFQNDASMMSLADIAANPSIGYGNVVDLDHIYSQAATIGKALDAAAQELIITGKLDKYSNIVTQMGIPIDDILDPNKRVSNVQKAMQSLFDLSGVGSWGDTKIVNETWNAIILGTIAGMQGKKLDVSADFGERLKAQTEAAIDKAIARKGDGSIDLGKYISDGNGNYIDPVHRFKFRLDDDGNPVFVGYMPSSSTSNRGGGSSTGSTHDIYISGTADSMASIDTDPTPIVNVPSHVKAQAGENQEDMQYYAIRDKKGKIIGYRKVQVRGVISTQEDAGGNYGNE